MRTTVSPRFVFALLLTFLSGVVCSPAVLAQDAPVIYVNPTGLDTATGTLENPLATITKALAVVPDFGTIEVAPGHYPRVTDSRDHFGVTVHGAEGAIAAGITLTGASGLTFDNLDLTSTIFLDHKSNLSNPTNNITFTRTDISSGYSGACVRIVNGTSNVTVRDSRLHACNFGLHGPGRVGVAYSSHDILVENNVIEDIKEDGLQFGYWYNVRIIGNTIRNAGIGTPTTDKHPDGIQIYGHAHNIEITNNRIGPARSQAVIIQTDHGPVSDVRASGNRVGRSGAVAFRLIGITGAQITNNVICGKIGALWLEPSAVTPVVDDAIFTNNILRGEATHISHVFRIYNGAKAATNTGNVASNGLCSELNMDANQ